MSQRPILHLSPIIENRISRLCRHFEEWVKELGLDKERRTLSKEGNTTRLCEGVCEAVRRAFDADGPWSLRALRHCVQEPMDMVHRAHQVLSTTKEIEDRLERVCLESQAHPLVRGLYARAALESEVGRKTFMTTIFPGLTDSEASVLTWFDHCVEEDKDPSLFNLPLVPWYKICVSLQRLLHHSPDYTSPMMVETISSTLADLAVTGGRDDTASPTLLLLESLVRQKTMDALDRQQLDVDSLRHELHQWWEMNDQPQGFCSSILTLCIYRSYREALHHLGKSTPFLAEGTFFREGYMPETLVDNVDHWLQPYRLPSRRQKMVHRCRDMLLRLGRVDEVIPSLGSFACGMGDDEDLRAMQAQLLHHLT